MLGMRRRRISVGFATAEVAGAFACTAATVGDAAGVDVAAGTGVDDARGDACGVAVSVGRAVDVGSSVATGDGVAVAGITVGAGGVSVEVTAAVAKTGVAVGMATTVSAVGDGPTATALVGLCCPLAVKKILSETRSTASTMPPAKRSLAFTVGLFDEKFRT
jgi:hypothetical protein